jgi:serine/threonine protein phosphatase 1
MHWVIGDVHGMLRPLELLLELIGAEDSSPTLVFAGDYVNRGPDSAKVIDLLLTLDDAHFIRGNHDDIFDLILHGRSFAEGAANASPVLAFQWFMDYGLDSTLYSYGADWAWLTETARSPTSERMAQIPLFVPDDHKRFIRNLPPVFERKDFFVLHGHWPITEKCFPPSVAENLRTDPSTRQRVLWGRYSMEAIKEEKPWGKRGFFGHTPVHTYFKDPRKAPMVPIAGPKIVLLDTACALVTWGRLTAYCVEEDRYLQVTHFGEAV